LSYGLLFVPPFENPPTMTCPQLFAPIACVTPASAASYDDGAK
jgi:hypothetical protein